MENVLQICPRNSPNSSLLPQDLAAIGSNKNGVNWRQKYRKIQKFKYTETSSWQEAAVIIKQQLMRKAA